MYRCAIVGVGGNRANGHADAYRTIERGRLVAVSTRNPEKLAAFGERHGVTARYTDYREMFAQERLDLVHVNTPPDVRLEIFQAAAAAGIPALVVEKPLAIQWEDYQAIAEFARTSPVKIAVNHQLHFHPRRTALQRLVAEGCIGAVRFVDASAGLNMAFQGTHTLQAIRAFLPNQTPQTVFAQATGTDGLQPTPRQHYAPDALLATLDYGDGITALLRCGSNAPRVLADDPRAHIHKRIGVYGEKGYVHWSMWNWEVGQAGRVERGSHEYGAEDVLGQAALTEAMFDWLEDDRAVHPLNLDVSLQDFAVMLHIYESALHWEIRRLGGEDSSISHQAELMAALRERLG
jgi:predicted dehydrogenase